MTYTRAEIDSFEEMIDYNHAIAYARNHHNMKFNVGDILIEKMYQNGSWKTVVDDYNAPLKYRYIYESEDGHGIVAELDEDGKIDRRSIKTVADFLLIRHTFEVDPEYLDHIMIGSGEFDACKRNRELQKMMEENDKFNKKLIQNTSTIAACNEIMSSIYVGQHVYVCIGYIGQYTSVRELVTNHKYEVKAIRRVKMNDSQIARHIGVDALHKKNKKNPAKYYYYTMYLKDLTECGGSLRVNTMTLKDSKIIVGNAKSYESSI